MGGRGERGQGDRERLAKALGLGRPRFELGFVGITPNALDTLHQGDVEQCLGRHHRGDWGDLCDEDREANERALKEGSRLFSVYKDRLGARFYIITEWDRSQTTVLLPEDY